MRGRVGFGIAALLLGVLVGVLGSGGWLVRMRGDLDDARKGQARLERQLDDLRAENARMEAQLRVERARADTTADDLRREKQMTNRLQVLIGDGKK